MLVISGPNVCQSNPRSGNMTRYFMTQTIHHLHDLYTERDLDLDAKIPVYLANDYRLIVSYLLVLLL